MSRYAPEVSKELIEELAETIHPVVEFDGKKYFIEKVDLFGIAFTWDPKKTEEAVGLKEVATITTFHSWAYYGFFKPTIAEILNQIPEDLRYKVKAFEIVDWPREASDFNKTEESAAAFKASYHTAKTTLYTM
jgi:hypothetical protein